MALQQELYRTDLTTLTTAGEPVAGSAYFRRKGATVTVAGTADLTQNVTVSDVGTIVVGDHVQVNGEGPIGTVNPAGYAKTNLNITFPSAPTIDQYSRLIVTAADGEASLYADPFGTTAALTQPVSFGASDGLLSVYHRCPEVDIVRTVAGSVDVIVDQAGLGGRHDLSILDWNGAADGSTNNATALSNALFIAQVRDQTVIQLPPGEVRIGSTILPNGITGVTVRGYGKSSTILNFTTAGALFTVTNCTDLVFEDMTIGRTVAGSSMLIAVTSGCSRVGFRNVHFTSGSSIATDQGSDTFFDGCSADGASWNGGFLFYGAKRPRVRDFVARLSNSFATPFFDVDQGTESPKIINPDVAPSDPSTYSFPVMRVKNSVVANAGPSNIVVESPYFVAGASHPAVQVQPPASGTKHPRGITITNMTCEDSERALITTGGIGITVTDLTSVGMVEEAVYINAGTGVTSLSRIRSSHIGAAKAHVRIDGAVSDIDVSDVKGGNFLRDASGNTANAVVDVADGAGERVTIGPNISRASTSDVTNVVVNSKLDSTTQRTDIHQLHSTKNVGTGERTGMHEGFAFYSRYYTNGDPTPDVSNCGTLKLNYGAGITITDFDGGTGGQILFVENVGVTNAITLDCTASNLIPVTPGDITLAVGDLRAFYKMASGEWHEISVAQ